VELGAALRGKQAQRLHQQRRYTTPPSAAAAANTTLNTGQVYTTAAPLRLQE